MLYSHVTPPSMISGVRESAEYAVRAGFKFIQFFEPEEEMAKYIFDLEMGLREIPYCQGNDRCSYLMDSGREIPESMCTECVKMWRVS